jgi:hypothetical protein
MGYSSLFVLSLLYLSLYERENKEKLVCDVCELGKQIRSSYRIFGNRSSRVFDLIHSYVWGSYSANTINSYRYFVIFIDCFSRVTWLYLMKNKSEVLAAFQEYLSTQGILH